MTRKLSLLLFPFIFISCVTTGNTNLVQTDSEPHVVQAEENVKSEDKEVSSVESIDERPLLDSDNIFTNLLSDESIAFSDLTHEDFEKLNPVSSDDRGSYVIYSFDADDPNAVIAFGQDTILIQAIDWIELSGPGFTSSLQIGLPMEEIIPLLSEVYGDPDYISEPGTRPLDYYGWSNISSNFVIGFLPDTNSLFSIEF